jgi:transposase
MDNYHHHARLTIIRREELCRRVLEGRLSLNEAMAEFKLSRQSAAKWVRRYREHGVAGLRIVLRGLTVRHAAHRRKGSWRSSV